MKTLMIYNNTIDWFNPFNNFLIPEFMEFNRSSAIEEFVNETEESIEYRFNMQGIKRKNIKLNIEDNCILLNAKLIKVDNNLLGMKNNYFKSSFSKKLFIGNNININNIKAKLKNGWLTISIPKKAKLNSAYEIPINDENSIADTKVINNNPINNVLIKTRRWVKGLLKKI